MNNKLINIWKRSGKDLRENGIFFRPRIDTSRDNRIRVRWFKFAIYIGKPGGRRVLSS